MIVLLPMIAMLENQAASQCGQKWHGSALFCAGRCLARTREIGTSRSGGGGAWSGREVCRHESGTQIALELER